MTSFLALSGGDLVAWLGKAWWPFLRIGALLWALPLFGDYLQTAQVRVLLALLLASLLAPMMPAMPAVDPFSLQALALAGEQILFGLLLGLMVQMLFTVMTMLGQILSLQMSLAMAVMNDPAHGESVPLMGQLLMVLAAFLFFCLDGHLVVLDVVVESFYTWPPGASLFQLDLQRILGLFGWVFGSALILAMPAIIAMLVVNLCFGVMNRSAPSLNIFALGFPMSMTMGLLCLLLTVSGVPGRFADYTAQAMDEMRLMVTGVAP
ncbi:flagellar biosynthetic protein FliR [Gallaecimonas xiamenensis]|uniref:Flagellar biosynthetic protein FliR n=1 Tax=Gallaecimonas xiamenensis 3-C-1 TaxID=745411 RepID=K2JU87_9GAMM|nr:flagellar biosynthetic protein FliR [Gallaecimonas xiamenensis]EKE73959.1 lateral flagellar biosynthetic protein LfiR [Gallaecimonas xiamenensis 3-C-1]